MYLVSTCPSAVASMLMQLNTAFSCESVDPPDASNAGLVPATATAVVDCPRADEREAANAGRPARASLRFLTMASMYVTIDVPVYSASMPMARNAYARSRPCSCEMRWTMNLCMYRATNTSVSYDASVAVISMTPRRTSASRWSMYERIRSQTSV